MHILICVVHGNRNIYRNGIFTDDTGCFQRSSDGMKLLPGATTLMTCRNTCAGTISFFHIIKKQTIKVIAVPFTVRTRHGTNSPSCVLTKPVTPSVTIQAQPASVIPRADACSRTSLPKWARQFRRTTRAPQREVKKFQCLPQTHVHTFSHFGP